LDGVGELTASVGLLSSTHEGLAMKWIAFAAVACWAGSAQAAVIHIKPTLGAVYDSQFNDVTSTALIRNENGYVTLAHSMERYTLQVDFSFTISDLQAEQLGFGNAAFNILVQGMLNQPAGALDFTWNPEAGKTIDSNGTIPGGLRDKWADNGDYGRPGDLYGIVVGTDPPDFGPINIDPRRVFGQNGDEYFGNVFFEFPANVTTFGELEIRGDGGNVYDASNNLVAAGVTVTGESIHFAAYGPEPSSAILLGLGGMLLAAAGRRWPR
jgi:hypothetical protein